MQYSDAHTDAHNEPLTREQVEALLPDYVFEQLDEQDHAAVERSLPLYPELASDAAEMRSAFAMMEVETLREQRKQGIAKRVRNLSYRVQERLADDRARHRKRVMLFRWLTPVLATCTALGVVLAPDGTFEAVSGTSLGAVRGWFTTSQTEAAYDRSLLRPAEARLLLEDNANGDGVVETDVSFKDNAALNDTNADAQEKESLVAARMLSKETLAELSQQVSPFSDTFAGDSGLLQGLDDNDVDDDDVTALMNEIG
jgi:hypothetical protein